LKGNASDRNRSISSEHQKRVTVSSHLTCEYGFSQYTATKTKHSNELYAEADLRLQLAPILLHFRLMCSSKQPHPLHWEINTQGFLLSCWLSHPTVKFYCYFFAYEQNKSYGLHSITFPIMPTQQRWVPWNMCPEKGSTKGKVLKNPTVYTPLLSL
jgi:hypothetical protein